MTRLFIYGTLKHPIVRWLLLRKRVPVTPATLPQYRKVGRNVVPDEQASVSGFILEVNERQLAILDRYEKVPLKYERESHMIDGIETEVYVMTTL